MILEVQYQEEYKRGELLLRTFFGWLYIGIPHLFLLFFISIGASFFSAIAFFMCLFGMGFPRSWFEYIVKMYRWQLRVNASLSNLVDGTPPFGLDAEWDKVRLELDYPEKFPPISVLGLGLFGWLYVAVPHGIALFGRLIATTVLQMLAWWVVLFTGKYPERWHAFNVGTLRWSQRVSFHLLFMTFDYPPFSGKP